MKEKRKDEQIAEIKSGISTCNINIANLERTMQDLELLIEKQKDTKRRFESECEKYEFVRQKKARKLENMSYLIPNVKLVRGHVDKMEERVTGSCFCINRNRLVNMMAEMDNEIIRNENLLEEKVELISINKYRKQCLKENLRRL